MSVLSSLTNRIFLASALLVLASMGVAISRVNVSVSAQAENDLEAGLSEAASLVDRLSRTEFNDFVVKAALIADLPVLKGAAATEDPPTVGVTTRTIVSVEVPHCGQHKGGAQLSGTPSNPHIKFRSYRYLRAFCQANGTVPG